MKCKCGSNRFLIEEFYTTSKDVVITVDDSNTVMYEFGEEVQNKDDVSVSCAECGLSVENGDLISCMSNILGG